LYFGDRVAVLNDFIYQTGGSSLYMWERWAVEGDFFFFDRSSSGWVEGDFGLGSCYRFRILLCFARVGHWLLWKIFIFAIPWVDGSCGWVKKHSISKVFFPYFQEVCVYYRKCVIYIFLNSNFLFANFDGLGQRTVKLSSKWNKLFQQELLWSLLIPKILIVYPTVSQIWLTFFIFGKNTENKYVHVRSLASTCLTVGSQVGGWKRNKEQIRDPDANV
jgi:hypothetical protein